MIAFVYLLIAGYIIGAVSLALILLMLGIAPIGKLTLMDGSITVDKYFCYGFKRKRIVIAKQSSIKAEIFVNGDIDQVPDGDSPLGLIVFLIPFIYKKYALWLKTPDNKTVTIFKLTKKEFLIVDEDRRYGKTLPLT